MVTRTTWQQSNTEGFTLPMLGTQILGRKSKKGMEHRGCKVTWVHKKYGPALQFFVPIDRDDGEFRSTCIQRLSFCFDARDGLVYFSGLAQRKQEDGVLKGLYIFRRRRGPRFLPYGIRMHLAIGNVGRFKHVHYGWILPSYSHCS